MRRSFLAAPLFSSILVAACGPKADLDTGEAPGELVAGFAQARLPAPLGIGTSGYGPFDAPDSETPYADLFPGTTRFHGFPDLRVTTLSRGDGHELVFVRLATVGVFQQLRRAVVLEVLARTGRDIDDTLLLGGTHTHSGPGRIVDAEGVFSLLADTFFPEYYDRLIDGIADAIEASWADSRPARLGLAWATSHDGHGDRRCEDGEDYENGAIPLVLVERDGVVDGLVMAYAVHGTLLGIEDLTLSRDAMGGIEHAVEDLFDHPVHVQSFNAWGGDMSPGDPPIDAGEGADMPGGYDRMEQVGRAVAEAVEIGLAAIAWDGAPEIRARSFRVPVDREVIGYERDEFPYEYGGVYCNSTTADCDPATVEENLDHACLPFSEESPAPRQTEFTVGVLGDLGILTFTGEPGTKLAEKVMAGMAPFGFERVLFLGYTQDYLGYSILEEDWWQGGYEASGALWGPRQGEYLSDQLLLRIGAFFGRTHLGADPEPLPPFDDPRYTPLVPTPGIGVGNVLIDVSASYGPTDVVELVVAGGDPWLGAPLAVLEREDGTPALRPGGLPVESDSYRFWVDLAPTPPYTEASASRSFAWSFHMPVRHRYDATTVVPAGVYRLRVSLPTEDGGVTEVTSALFEVRD
jgi:hypothetical protein